MAPPKQVSSLSSITQLAANPPQYPRNPTLAKREALVLYIARVPGSKDIVLTPLKPGLKNLTAGDVDSSLYYLHLDLLSDRLLIQAMREDSEDPKVKPMVLEPVKRKPVNGRPSTGQILQSDQLIGRFKDTPDAMLSTSEKSAGTNSVTPYAQEFPSNKVTPQLPSNSPVLRRPLGPRPLVSVQQYVGMRSSASPGRENKRNVENDSSTVPATSAQPRVPPMYGAEVFNETSKRSIADTTDHFGSSMAESNLDLELSITLIRRNPPSGAQWNIGRITCSPTSSDETSTSKHPNSLVTVHISTPGYNKFQILPVTHRTEGSCTSATESPSRFGFYREVLTDGSDKWDRTFRYDAQADSDFFSAQIDPRDRTGSDVATKEHSMHNHSVKPRLKNCHFISPWNGRCDFSTGSSGRSLKCTHQLPGTDQLGSLALLTVSELRFNLPSADVFKSSDATDKSQISKSLKPAFGHKRNSMSSGSSSAASATKLDPTSYAALYPSDEEDGDGEDGDDDRLGLSLGREKAGGGNRGKRTKLGKLIVHDEGLKMLDLVVAANMGIWWRTWQG